MAKVRRLGRNSKMPTRLSIPTLSGGVGRQAPSKRTPFEAENIDNCLVTIEKSIEKRPGFQLLKTNQGNPSLQEVVGSQVNNYFFYWLNIDELNRFVIIIDYSARGPTDKLFYVYRVLEEMWEDKTPSFQWDSTDVRLSWDGVGIIQESDPRFPIYSLVAQENGGTVTLGNYNNKLSLGVVSKDSRKYITFGSSAEDTAGKTYTPKEALRVVSLGTNTLVLNTVVYAGFSSNIDGYEYDMNGNITTNVDIKGRKVTYYSAAKIQKTNFGRLFPQGTSLSTGETYDPNWISKYIPVEDYVYGDLDRPWIGQSVGDFSEIRFPPDKNDWYSNNSDLDQNPDDDKARLMLKELYDSNHPHKAATYPVDGRGKIYYCASPYLGQSAGYYRIINFPETETYDPVVEAPTNTPGVVGTGRPYVQRVRTPYAFSVLDEKRMPQNIEFNATTGWKVKTIEWTPRTTGTIENNPGPSPFLSTDKKTATPSRINALAVFRDRLFFAVRDVVFSSRLGDFQNFWIEDPSGIITADPIDIRASLNQYAEIISLTPFDEFLFVNTKGSVQFELKGSQNIISPLTAEISPTTFYATAPLVEPVLLGSQVYFFDSKRLYVYFSQKVRGLNTAIELSSTCPDYLPVNFGSVCTAPAQDTILAVDADNKNLIYLYTNRYSGERVLQSAFFRFVLNEEDEVVSMQSYDNYLYALIYRKNYSTLYLTKCLLKSEDPKIPRLDFYSTVTINSGADLGLDYSFTVPYSLPYDDVYVVLGEDFGNMAGSTIKAEKVIQGNSTQLSISGLDFSGYPGKTMYVGGSFLMNVQLSEQFLRDDTNNVVSGVLNIRTLITRHNNTGHYKVVSIRRGRSEDLESEFSFVKLNKDNDRFEKDGDFVSKIFGFSDNTQIFITSNLPAPTNITQIELKGKFKQKYTSLR